ncbi:MAG TPA: GerMN domain-containing protein [Clostridia bacterium]|nr:GerMN domain-containing protein [Clostridia bacterium]
MKKVLRVCIVTLIIAMMVACGRTSKTPEGLIKKDKEDVEGADTNSSLLSKDLVEENEDISTLIQHNVSLYFLDNENNKLTGETRNIITSDAGLILDEMIVALIRGPESNNLDPVISKRTKVIDIDRIDNIVTVNLSEHFLESEDLIVARTALVNTLTELDEIKHVKININGEELTRDGTENESIVGVLSKSTNNIDELMAAEARKDSEDNVKEISKEFFFRDFRGRYLLSEVRPIKVTDGEIAKAIIEGLIKGPVEVGAGLYPVMPQGTQLLDINIIDGVGDSKVIALYFSKEFKAPFTEEGISRGDKKLKPKEIEEKALQIENIESIILSSIVYSLDGLPGIEGIKIFYEDRYGNYTDKPLQKIDLKRTLKARSFPGKLGRKIKIYFADSGASYLTPDYRSMARNNLQIANTIIDELILGPREDAEQIRVIPEGVVKGDIKVWMGDNNSKVMVDLPGGKLDGNKMGSSGSLMLLYAIVNSLTDPLNTPNIKEVQFLIDGQVISTFGNVEFSEPFIRNPAIIQE